MFLVVIADEMGNVMQEMAENMQLIVITHLAQVAAKGNDNYKVQKSDIEGKTQTTIFPLNQRRKTYRNCAIAFWEARLQMPLFFRQKNSCNKFCNENIVLETND